MFCKYCGTKLIDEAAFCQECGKPTSEQPAQPVFQQPVPPARPVQVVYQQPVYTPPAYTAPVPPTPPVQPVYQQNVPPTPPVQPVYQQNVPPQYTYTVSANSAQTAPQPAVSSPESANQEQQILTFGILGLCLSMLGVPGIIFSSIAGNKANEYKQQTGTLDGKAGTGYRLAKAGKIVSIIMTVILTIVVLTLTGEADYDFTNPFDYYDF